jgi:RNA polymerase sigma factor (sigma-70 family)
MDGSQVIQEHSKLIKKLAHRYKTHSTSADILAAAARSAILQHWKNYDPDKSSIETWILVLCKTAFVDSYRAHNVVKFIPSVTSLEDADVSKLMDDTQADTEVLKQEVVEQVQLAIQQLPVHERIILQMKFGLGDYGETADECIAETLGMSIRAYYNSLASAYRKLGYEDILRDLYYDR